jgi:hypothetical protein
MIGAVNVAPGFTPGIFLLLLILRGVGPIQL